MIVVQVNRKDQRRQEFVSKLNYSFSAVIDSVALFNPNAPVGYIYIKLTADTLLYEEKKIARGLGPEARRARFLEPANHNTFRMFSKDARLYKTGDSLYVNTGEDRMRLFHEQNLLREFTISEEIVY
jgi:hypothetical protein